MDAIAETIEQAYSAPLTSDDEASYKSVSRGAIASFVLALLSFPAFWLVGLLMIPAVGLGLGITALLAIRKYPDELLGKPLAIIGSIVSSIILITAPAWHGYVYATEVPPGYKRINFSDLKSSVGAADVPTEAALNLNGKQVFVKGYIHPTSMDSVQSKKFVLVPDLGTCCFGGQPPLTHMIEVTLAGDQYATKSYRRQRLAGTLRVNTNLKPVAGLEGVFYQLKADILK